MVELKLEALDFDLFDKDTYVAVRVGENQKLSRLSAVRNFKFPQSVLGDRKFGKVDVFRRVGTASVGIRYDADTAVQELQVPVSEGAMNFRVTLAGDEKFKVAPKKDPGSTAVTEAKSYLMQHNLELVLADAMQAVLREKPANPSQFIAEKLLKSEGTYKRVLSEGRAQTAPQGGTRTQAAPTTAVVAPAAAATPAPASAAKAAPASLLQRSEFEPAISVEDFNMTANTPMATASQKLFSLFPQVQRKTEIDHSAPAAKASVPAAAAAPTVAAAAPTALASVPAIGIRSLDIKALPDHKDKGSAIEPPIVVEDMNTIANTPMAGASQRLYALFPQIRPA